MEVQVAGPQPLQVFVSIILLMVVCMALGWQFCVMYASIKKEADQESQRQIKNLNTIITERGEILNTLDSLLKQQLQPELHGVMKPEAIAKLVRELDWLPGEINRAALNLDKTVKDIMQVQQQIKEAEQNLKVAELMALAFPERELKNDSQRKVYIAEKTKQQQKAVLELHKRKSEYEMAKMEVQSEYNRLQDSFAAVKHKASIVSSMLQYLAG